MQQSKIKSFLVFGGNSRLAKCFFSLYPNETILIAKSDCDITKKKSIRSILQKYKSPYILNCAAITDIDFCEQNPKICFDTNIIGVHNLQELCKAYNRKFIHMSSNYACFPINMYGWSKYISEKIIDRNNLIIRTSFYDTETFIINSLLNNKITPGYINMSINPISIQRLVYEIYKRKAQKGIKNIFSEKKISWYEFADIFCQIFDLDNKLVKKSEFNNKNSTPRPLNSFIKSDIKISLENDLKDFRHSLEMIKSNEFK